MKNIAYVNGKFIELKDSTISIEDRGFQFGDGIYEVIKLYQGELFKADEHFERLLNSAELIKLDIGYSIEGLKEISKKVLNHNQTNENSKEGSLYIQVTRGVAPRSHSYSLDLKPTIIMYLLSSKALPLNLRTEGVKAITVPDKRWHYCNIKSTNLLPNILAKQEAKERGVLEGIFVNGEDIVTEGTSSNVFIVEDELIKTHPNNERILGGVTRDVVLEIADEEFKVKEEAFTKQDLYQADEVFITSTTKEVLGVVNIDDKKIGDGQVGEITKELYNRYNIYKDNLNNF